MQTAVAIVDNPIAFSTHLKDPISKLIAMGVTVFECSRTKEAIDAITMNTHLDWCACVTNMKRTVDDSGIRFIRQLKNLELTKQHKIPCIMYSQTAALQPDASINAGAFSVFCGNTNLLFELLNILTSQRKFIIPIASPIVPIKEFEKLFTSHCLEPLPNDKGGCITPQSEQDLYYRLTNALWAKLLPHLLNAISSTVASMPHIQKTYCIGGATAINYWLVVNSKHIILTNDIDVRFKDPAAVPLVATELLKVVKKRMSEVKCYFATVNVSVSKEPYLKVDNYGQRLLIELRHFPSGKIFSYKFADISHNWKQFEPQKIVLTSKVFRFPVGVCIESLQDCKRDLKISHNVNKETRRMLRDKYLNLVL